MSIILTHPVDKPVISQLFGQDFSYYDPTTSTYYMFYKHYGLLGHPGIDYACPVGTPVKATHDGICLYAGYDATNGNLVQVWSESLGFKTLYGHNSVMNVKQGDAIKKGQLIALSGSTGAGTGPHVHFGMKMTGQGGNGLDNNNGYNGACDPMPYIKNESKENMVIKKEKGQPSIYLINEELKTKTMIVDMETLNNLGGKFEEVDSLSEYNNKGTLVFVERIIN